VRKSPAIPQIESVDSGLRRVRVATGEGCRLDVLYGYAADVEIRVIGPVDPEWLGLTVAWLLHPIGG